VSAHTPVSRRVINIVLQSESPDQMMTSAAVTLTVRLGPKIAVVSLFYYKCK